MRAAPALLLVLAVAACATDSGGKADLKQAARINTQIGIDYLRQGNLEMAQQKLERALEQDDDYAPTHTAIAMLHGRRGDQRLAERHYRRALALTPDDPDLRNNFGVFLCGEGRTKEGTSQFMEAVQNRRYATPEVAWTNAGLCVRSEDAARAEINFREALRLNPQFPDALAQMAGIAYRKRDFLAARAFVQRFDATGRSNAEVFSIGAATERELGDELAARKYEMRLRRDFPNSPEAPRPASPT